MMAEVFGGETARTDGVRKALAVLDGLDRRRNLGTGTAILVFFASAGIGATAFFLIIQLTPWNAIDESIARLLVGLSWILIFPIWIIAFGCIMSGLKTMGLIDIRSAAHDRLSALALHSGELLAVHRSLAGRVWRHESIFTSVLIELVHEAPRDAFP